MSQKLGHRRDNWEIQSDIFCTFSTFPTSLISFPLPPPQLFPTFLIHQLAWLPPSNPPPLLSHFSTFSPTFPSFSLFLSLHPSLPPLAPSFEPGLVSVDPEVCHWADGLISGWGNALRRAERGQGPGPGASACTCCLHKIWEKLLLPWCLEYLNWQCSPVLTAQYRSPSISAALTESMAYDSKITGLCFWSNIVILCSLSLYVSQYQRQLGPLSVHPINKHDCPEVHAELFIFPVSRAESFVIDPIWNFSGWCSSLGDLLSATVSRYGEEVGKLEAEISLSCVCVQILE